MARYTMDVGPEFDETLSKLAESKGTTKAEIIRRAVASYSYLSDATKETGSKVTVTDTSGTPLKEIILP
jgi:predicted transcriptional regulator